MNAFNSPPNSSLSPFDVAVIGGGLVGKSTALALAQNGLRVALLAQPCAPLPADAVFDVRVYAFSGSSQALLERLRVWQAIDPARIAPVYDMRVFGDAAAELHFSAWQAAVPQLAWIAESAVVGRALDAALHFQPSLTWFDARAQTLDTSAQADAAIIGLDDGKTIAARLAIGADGAHSWVRAQIGARVTRRAYRQTGVVANFRAQRAHGETAYQWFDKGEIIALLPLPDDHVSLVWSAATEHADALLALTPAQLATEVERVTHGQPGALECVTPARGFPLALQTVERLVAPRVALIGDAAHLIHPLAGQGVNLGLRDAAALIDVLEKRETFRDLGDITLLRRYERNRREDIRKLVIATDGLQRLFSFPGTLARTLRNAGMALVGAQPLVKRWLVASALG